VGCRLLAEVGHEVVNFDLVSRPELELPGEFCRVELTDAGKVYDALFQFRPEGICPPERSGADRRL
jgi:hypothetical protein